MVLNSLKKLLDEAGEPNFRLKQIQKAFFQGLISDWSEASSLPEKLRLNLKAELPISSLEVVSEKESAGGDTLKVAFRLNDGNLIETVLMRHKDGRHTICVSSQAGCPMACSFCATGTLGLKRNLKSDEIVDQIMHFARKLKPLGESVSNVVFMGMGEPMNNYDEVLAAVRTMNDPECLGLGARRISISTCGVVPGILKLADEPLQVNLAISLHAPNDELRTRLMPVNRAYPLAKLMPAIEQYLAKTNRKIFFEYLMIDNLNDTPEIAEELARLLRHPLYHVNLIKYHTTGAYVTSPTARRSAFMEILEKRGVSVTHRVTFGEDIDAACGQLAAKQAAKSA